MNAEDIFNEFMNSPKKKRVVKLSSQYELPGVGRKLCDGCKKYVGVRTKVCECGHEFTKPKTKQDIRRAEDAPTDEELLYARAIGAPGGRVVYAGIGTPSIRLSTITSESVKEYCDLVVHCGIQDGLIYTTDAIKKYIQHQYGYESKFYKRACEIVDQWYNEKMGIDIPSSEGVEDV